MYLSHHVIASIVLDMYCTYVEVSMFHHFKNNKLEKPEYKEIKTNREQRNTYKSTFR